MQNIHTYKLGTRNVESVWCIGTTLWRRQRRRQPSSSDENERTSIHAFALYTLIRRVVFIHFHLLLHDSVCFFNHSRFSVGRNQKLLRRCMWIGETNEISTKRVEKKTKIKFKKKTARTTNVAMKTETENMAHLVWHISVDAMCTYIVLQNVVFCTFFSLSFDLISVSGIFCILLIVQSLDWN